MGRRRRRARSRDRVPVGRHVLGLEHAARRRQRQPAGVKAFAPKDVWAVGSQIAAGMLQTRTLVMHWNGSAWSVVPSANPEPNIDSLHAIDGISSNDLWAVGQQARWEAITGVAPGTRTLTEHFNGSRWSVAATPNTADEDTLSGVAAVASAGVSLSGTSSHRGGSIPVDRTLAQRSAGTSWVTDPSANVGTTDNLLTGAAAIPGTIGLGRRLPPHRNRPRPDADRAGDVGVA